MRDRDPECSVFWIPCTSHEAIEQAWMTIAQAVEISDATPTNSRDRIKIWLTHRSRKWLLIFDNADVMEMWTKGNSTASPLEEFVPYNDQGHVIITTRDRNIGVRLAHSNVILLPELNEGTGLEFLAKLLIEPSLLDDSHAAMSLLGQLCFLPLAVAQATAYINQNGLAIPDYLLLQEQEADVVELLSEDFRDDGRYGDIQNLYLRLMACVDPRNIPQSFFPQPGSRKQMTDALGILGAYSFIKIHRESGSITLHRLVRLATRNWMKKEAEFSTYTAMTADRFSEVFLDYDHQNGQVWIGYMPHALSLLDEIEYQIIQRNYPDFIENLGLCLLQSGRYQEAENLLMWAMKFWDSAMGPEHPRPLQSMKNLGYIYWYHGKLEKAEELGTKVLNRRSQVLGPEQPDNLTSMIRLARIYYEQTKFEKAEELDIQVFETAKKVLGPEHPETLAYLYNLAMSRWSFGNPHNALQSMEICLKLREKALGPDHPDTMITSKGLNGLQEVVNHLQTEGIQKGSAESSPAPSRCYHSPGEAN